MNGITIIQNMKTMKKNILILSAMALVAGMTASCQMTEMTEGKQDTRSITVFSENMADTRTSIDYEYSDYSHLVWNEGDVVAYVTDLASDVVKEAEVSEGGWFTAEIPADAGADNSLYVLYPGDGLAGTSLSALRLEIAAVQEQDSLAASHGVEIPMYAVSAVPAAGQNSISVKYEIPVSVIRFEILSSDFSTDRIQSVTVTAGESLAGGLDVTRDDFTGSSNSVTTNILNAEPIVNGGYVYVPVVRGNYSGVAVEVLTDNNKFAFPDGTFDLDDPSASLYKVQMVLGEGSVVPAVPYFAEIQAGEQFSSDARYLLAHKESSLSYRVATKPNSSKIDSKLFEVDPELGGIPAEGEIMDYVFTITPVCEIDGKTYCSFYSSVLGSKKDGGYFGLASTSSNSGNIFYFQGDGAPTESDTQYLLTVSFEDGFQYIYNDIYSSTKTTYFKYNNSLRYFVSSNVQPGESDPIIEEVVILKLME